MKKTIILALILTIAIAGCTGTEENAPIEASGVIEANEVVIASEMGGRLIELLADEGDSVAADELLFTLESDLLEAQLDAANATLNSARAAQISAQVGVDAAKAQYALVLDAALAADEINRTTDWRIAAPGRFDQPAWYFTQAEELAAAEYEVEDAVADLAAAQNAFSEIAMDADSAGFLAAEIDLANARAAYLVARDVYSRSQATADRSLNKSHPDYKNRDNKDDDIDEVIDAAVDVLNESKRVLDAAELAYKELLGRERSRDVLEARAALTVAHERYNLALDYLRSLQTGSFSPTVSAAQTNVVQAEAALEQANRAIEQAQAQIVLLETQMMKMSTSAPIEGIILTSNIELGEIIQAGLPAMTIAPLNELTVTVYISENHYGLVSLGDIAILSVDSFPEESFEAKVVHIADQAEYTPRNIQTKEERQTTVFAIKLSVENVDGMLKPGMPADLVFE
ncbi:MAG: HlyD family efflux transporter periplasmic adaptor subunit [Chloroflexi bacterium]|nr:HlyD family efflux transporter periplasmic adaptor subunit [Chloroflexota bacterium]